MNKEITIYELLGLIKDNKIAKKIKYDGKIYEFKEIEEGTGYVNESEIIKKWLSNIIEIDNIKHLNNKVEIIEEDKKIEKLSRCSWQENGVTIQKMVDIDKVFDKVNELIDVVNELKKEVKE